MERPLVMNALRRCQGALARLTGVTLIALPLLAAAPAQTQLGPEELVRQVTSEVLAAIHSSRALQAGDKGAALALAEQKIFPHVDFRAATRLAAASAWRSATPQQRKQLVKEFRGMLVRIYSNAIDAYRGQTMRVLPVHVPPRATHVTVHNEYLKPGAPPVRVDYAMHETSQGWKIYDISIGGVSLVTTYREQFQQVARRSGIEGLIRLMARKNAATAAR